MAHSPQDIEADVVDLLSEFVRLKVEPVRLVVDVLLDARSVEVLAREVAQSVVTDGYVAVLEVVGVEQEREPYHDYDEGDP